MDVDLQNRLWNIINEDFIKVIDNSGYTGQSLLSRFCKILWGEFFKEPIDTIPSYNSGTVYIEGFVEYLRNWYYGSPWYSVYDLVEFISKIDVKIGLGFATKCNVALEKEMSGYRIINNQVAQITSVQEVEAIEEAISDTSKWKSVNTHLTTALELLVDRKSPDYRNSIKESISAVEAYCKILTGNDKTTLGKALAIIEKSHNLHTSLKSAFSALYGYTSDAGGIRHAILEDDQEIVFEDAKFMLVSCTSFINYLKAKFNTLS